MAGPRTHRETKEIVKTFKDHGPHRRNDKSKCQGCTCKIDKSLKRRTCIKFESRKICVAGSQCDNSDFNFHNAEHKELPVIKISSDNEGREDCPKLKTKGTQASLGTTVIAVTILLIHSSLFSRVTVMYFFYLARCVFHVIVYIVTRYTYDARRRDFALSARFVVRVF